MRPILSIGSISCLALVSIEGSAQPASTPSERNILANNAFFYYSNLEDATRFYTELLGLRIVADYGFAKILQVADTSYLTLVDAKSGMHTAEEPKTVALAFITNELEGWYEYLRSERVPMREPERSLVLEAGRPHHGFVVIDPEGYFLELERFNEHPENASLMPWLEKAPSVYRATGRRPPNLGIKATVTWMYYRDLGAIQRFYENVMGFDRVVDQGWAKVYQTSRTGFIGPVDESHGMHRYTKDKGVTVSFFTDDVDGWFEYLSRRSEFELRTKEILMESEKVRVFVGYDPENYFLEFDTFLDVAGNEELVRQLRRR